MNDTTTDTSRAPEMEAGAARSASMRGWTMWACCLAMVAGAGFLLFAAPPGQALGTTMLLALPLLGCLAMHRVHRRLTGRARQGDSHSKEETR